jgi:hypothetical protein
MAIIVNCYDGNRATLHGEELVALEFRKERYLISPTIDADTRLHKFSEAYKVVRTHGNGALTEKVTDRSVLSQLEKLRDDQIAQENFEEPYPTSIN